MIPTKKGGVGIASGLAMGILAICRRQKPSVTSATRDEFPRLGKDR
jgi:hypothetical protein